MDNMLVVLFFLFSIFVSYGCYKVPSGNVEEKSFFLKKNDEKNKKDQEGFMKAKKVYKVES